MADKTDRAADVSEMLLFFYGGIGYRVYMAHRTLWPKLC